MSQHAGSNLVKKKKRIQQACFWFLENLKLKFKGVKWFILLLLKSRTSLNVYKLFTNDIHLKTVVVLIHQIVCTGNWCQTTLIKENSISFKVWVLSNRKQVNCGRDVDQREKPPRGKKDRWYTSTVYCCDNIPCQWGTV